MNKPVFIIGCPRSGTTIMLNIMACHEQLSWVSNYLNSNPTAYRTSSMNRMYDIPFIGKSLYYIATQKGDLLPTKIRKSLPHPVEPWNFWNTHLSNFQWERFGTIPPRRRTANDITIDEINNIVNAVECIQQAQGKSRFLSKYTDFPRIKYLTQAFPDAKFVHIVRDGRAVTASYHEKIESGAFATWDEREWWIQGWPAEWRDEWQARFSTPSSFLAFQWKFFLREILSDAVQLPPEQYLEINYTDMINSPADVFNHIFEFCELSRSQRVEWYLDSINLINMNYKWAKKYSDRDKQVLNDVIHEPDLRSFLDS